MCGISGIINKNNKKVLKEEIKKINDLISHRGPDDEGFFFGDNFAFGHRRLAILDLSNDGHQPMHYLDKYTITYNGEIYNYLELREELIKEGYTFISNTDTEVILASYDKWGENCVNKFNGMWAFAIYNKEKNIIFCSRDRFGIKPFYYTEIDGKFIFGSEIKQLLPFFQINFVNTKVLMDYLILGYEEHTNETFFKNIYKLEQSHILIYDLETHIIQIKKYYDITKDYSKSNDKEKEAIEIYKKFFFESIKLRLRSDVKVGTCLSGGLDSSSIAAIASGFYNQISDKKFVAIHAKSMESYNDESLFARKVADHCDLDLKIVEPTFEDFKNSIDDIIETQEEPFGSPSIVMQYFVMKKAKDEQCTVMLDGQGGDETLLGYERYYPAYLKSLSFQKALTDLFLSIKNSKLTLKQLIGYILYFTNYKIRLFRLQKKYNFIKKEYINIISTDILKNSSESYLDIYQLQYSEIYFTQLPHLLKYEDKNSMIHSIETRLPFIDFKVLETALSLNNKFKIYQGWTKYILRKVVERILPKEIVWRKNKFGFEAPTATWIGMLENEMKKTIYSSILLSSILNKNFEFSKLDNKQKWKLFNIAKWERLYNIQIEQNDIK